MEVALGTHRFDVTNGAGFIGSVTTLLPANHVPTLENLFSSNKVYRLSVRPGTPVTLSFKITQPSGQTMTKFKRGSGPHTGVHLIIVREDLSTIIHRHPPEGPGGVFTQRVTFPSPGPYKVLVDVYPATTNQLLRNFQLSNRVIDVAGAYKPVPLPKPARADTIDGYHFDFYVVSAAPQ